MKLYVVNLVISLIMSVGCVDRMSLVKKSLGQHNAAKASASSVISMGRDDDDGKALKWHIGGRLNQ